MNRKYGIEMEDINVNNIETIDLVLENCENCEFFRNEIIDIKLDFEKTLVIGGGGIKRKIKSGYIKLDINDKNNRCRKSNMHDKKRPKKADIEKRLIYLSNICYIIITIPDYFWTEELEVPYDEKDDNESGYGDIIVCSSAKLDKEGNLIILMGDLSEYKTK